MLKHVHRGATVFRGGSSHKFVWEEEKRGRSVKIDEGKLRECSFQNFAHVVQRGIVSSHIILEWNATPVSPQIQVHDSYIGNTVVFVMLHGSSFTALCRLHRFWHVSWGVYNIVVHHKTVTNVFQTLQLNNVKFLPKFILQLRKSYCVWKINHDLLWVSTFLLSKFYQLWSDLI